MRGWRLITRVLKRCAEEGIEVVSFRAPPKRKSPPIGCLRKWRNAKQNEAYERACDMWMKTTGRMGR